MTTEEIKFSYPDFYPIIKYETLFLKNIFSNLEKIISHKKVSAFQVQIAQSIKDDNNIFSEFISLCHSHDTACLVKILNNDDQNKDLYKTYIKKDIDGFHFSSVKKFLSIIKNNKFISDLSLGCGCKTIDDAMIAGENGIDYVSFKTEDTRLFEKWSFIAEIPSVIENDDNDVDLFYKAAINGTDFISFYIDDDFDIGFFESLCELFPH